MRKVVKSLIFVLMLGLLTAVLTSCGGAARDLEGTWSGGGQSIYFNRDGSGTLALPADGNAPQRTRVFDWELDGDNMILTFVGYNETFQFQYDLDDPSPAIVVYVSPDEPHRFRRDSGVGRTLVGIWRRTNDPLCDVDRSLIFEFRDTPVESGIEGENRNWGIETDIPGNRRSVMWNETGSTFTTYYRYAQGEATTARGSFSISGDNLTLGIAGVNSNFSR